MISIDLKERSTWRGIAMAIAGGFGLYYIGPEISALSTATTTEQVQFLALKSTAIATAIGLAGQTASGLIGIIFSDKGA